MSSFVKLFAIFSAGLLTVGVAAEKSGDQKSKKPKETEKKDGKKEAKKPKADEPAKEIDVPIPKDHDAIGLNIPYRDENGKLKMRFIIGVAKRIDEKHIEMSQLQVETFDEQGEREMSMDLPTSVLDVTTSVITAQKQVTIRREDFELTGETMTFNTKTKQGGLGGNVRMLIYNLENEAADTASNPEPKAK